MKTGTKTAAILTALLAGTVIAEAQPYSQNQGQRQRQGRQGQRQQQGRQGQRQVQGRRQGCPLCGNPQFRPQGQRQRQQQSRQGSHQFQGRRGQRQQQGRQGVPQQFQGRQAPQQFCQQGQGQRQQFRGSQGQSGPNSRQFQQKNQKKRKAMLKKFDTDRDGRLSKEERQAVREAMEKRQRGKPGNASKRPGPPPGEE